MASVPLLPRRLLFGNPTRTSARISPDGHFLSYLAPSNGVMNVWVAPAGQPEAARPVSDDRKRGIRIHFWAYDSRTLLYLQDEGGNENWRLYATGPDGGEVRSLTPFEGVQARVEHLSPRHPGRILIGLNRRRPEYHDLYDLVLSTGELDLAEENDAFTGYAIDDELRPRIADRMREDGGRDLLLQTSQGWAPFISIGQGDSLNTGVAGFDASGESLLLVDSRGRDTSALMRIDLASGVATELASDPRADAGQLVRHPVDRTVQAVAFNYQRVQWRVLDPSVSADFDRLARHTRGEFSIVSRTLDDRAWIVRLSTDDAPDRFVRYFRDSGSIEPWFTTRPELEGARLSRMHSAVLEARDGLKEVAYYTLPHGSDTRAPGRPDDPLPTVLYVHGGPWARDHWGYSSYHQWLANRGYAVLSVNFRGSEGFGKGFVNAGDLQWGRGMHDDLVDAVKWAIAEGIADPARVAIMGGSYGGYAVLAGLTFTPDLFACGVDIVGPSNLVTLLESVPPYWKPLIQVFKTRVGNPDTPEGLALLRERSPLTHVGKICRPLLIGQGRNDPRVKQAESDQIVEAMRARQIPVTYLLYPDEGHGFGRPENSLSFTAVAEAFLAACLGGRFEPVGDDLAGSSVTVPWGAGFVPGLPEALDTAGRNST